MTDQNTDNYIIHRVDDNSKSINKVEIELASLNEKTYHNKEAINEIKNKLNLLEYMIDLK